MGSLVVNVTEAVDPKPGQRHTRYAIEVAVSLHKSSEEERAHKEWTITRKYYEFNRLYKALVAIGLPCPKIPARTMWLYNTAMRHSAREVMERRVVSLDMWLQGTLSTWRDHFLVEADCTVQECVTNTIVNFLCDDSNDFTISSNVRMNGTMAMSANFADYGEEPKPRNGNIRAMFKSLALRVFGNKPSSSQQQQQQQSGGGSTSFFSRTYRGKGGSSSGGGGGLGAHSNNNAHRHYYPTIQQEEELSLASLPALALTPPTALSMSALGGGGCYQRVVVVKDEDGDELTWVFDRVGLGDNNNNSAPQPEEAKLLRKVLHYEEDKATGLFTATIEASATVMVKDPLEFGFDMVSVPGTPRSRAQFQAPWREFTDKLVTHAEQRMKRTQLYQQNFRRATNATATSIRSTTNSNEPQQQDAHSSGFFRGSPGGGRDSGSEEGGSECGRTVLPGAEDVIRSRRRIMHRFALYQQDDADERNSEGWLSEAASEAIGNGLLEDLHVNGQFESGGMIWVAPKAAAVAAAAAPPPVASLPNQLLNEDDVDEGEEGDAEEEEEEASGYSSSIENDESRDSWDEDTTLSKCENDDDDDDASSLGSEEERMNRDLQIV